MFKKRYIGEVVKKAQSPSQSYLGRKTIRSTIGLGTMTSWSLWELPDYSTKFTIKNEE